MCLIAMKDDNTRWMCWWLTVSKGTALIVLRQEFVSSVNRLAVYVLEFQDINTEIFLIVLGRKYISFNILISEFNSIGYIYGVPMESEIELGIILISTNVQWYLLYSY